MAVFEYKAHIRYSDINEKNELSDKGLLNILSEAAGVHSGIVGYSLNELEQTGYSWMLLFWKVKITKRPRWNTELTIKTWARGFSKVSSWRDFEVYNDNELIAIATTEWVLIDARKNSIAKITDKMAEEYGIVEKQVFKENITGKIKESEDEEKSGEYTVTKRDIDANHHMNNICYLEIAQDAIPEDVLFNHENLEIYYKKQVKLNETVDIYHGKSDDEHLVAIKSKDGKNLHAVLKFF